MASTTTTTTKYKSSPILQSSSKKCIGLQKKNSHYKADVSVNQNIRFGKFLKIPSGAFKGSE
jgi:hypothetical protein